MIINTDIHGIWLEFLEEEVKPTLVGVNRFISDTSVYGTGKICADVEEDNEEALMLILSSDNIDEEFDRGLRKYVEERWGHKM